ncbi:MAG TPA: PorV/PorQ family protein [Chitinophagales bacterium]|nr:PorV/PorQ family protein [Chitinophagales bacterium]
MRKTPILIVVLLFISSSVFPQVVRKYSNDFLNIGVGARGLAMSNAQVATTTDAYSNYYNPAGLVGIPNTFQIGFMHCEYFAGIGKYDYLTVAVPVQQHKRVIGFSFYRFGVDDIPNTLFLVQPDGSINYNNITSFSAADYAFMFHYAQELPVKGLSIGGSAKIIYRQIGHFAKAYGFGIDAGLQYQYKNWHFGLMARDITSTFDAWYITFTDAEKQVLLQTNNQLPNNSLEITPPRIILGAAYEAVIKKKFTILPEINFALTTDGKENVLIPGKPISVDMNAGLELKYAPAKDIDISLRAGVGNLQRATDELGKKTIMVAPNIGAGLHIKIVSIDYALTNLTTLSSGSSGAGLYSNVISVRLDITKKVKE